MGRHLVAVVGRGRAVHYQAIICRFCRYSQCPVSSAATNVLPAVPACLCQLRGVLQARQPQVDQLLRGEAVGKDGELGARA
jgi:hypothetical protein